MKTVKIHKICYNWSAPNMQSNMLVLYQLVIFLNWYIYIYIYIYICAYLSQNRWFVFIFSFRLVWGSERRVFVTARRRKWTNKEHGKKNRLEIMNSTCHLYLSSKLVIFKKFWMCLVIPQTLGEGRLLEFTQIKNK